MGFRNPITTAEDPVARQQASDALAAANSRNRVYGPSATAPTAPSGGFTTGDQWLQTLSGGGVALNVWTGNAWAAQTFGAGTLAAGAVVAGTVAAGAIDGMTITGVTLRTAADGQPRVRVYEGADGKGNPLGIIALEDGVTGDVAAQLSAGSYGGLGGGALTISGGTYAGKAAASLTLSTDQAGLQQASLTAANGFNVNGQPWARQRVWTLPRSLNTGDAQDTLPAGSWWNVIAGTISAAPAGDYSVTVTLVTSAAAATTGYIRSSFFNIQPWGDFRADPTPQATPKSNTASFFWGGGDMPITIAAYAAAQTATIYTAGSMVSVAYLGPRT